MEKNHERSIFAEPIARQRMHVFVKTNGNVYLRNAFIRRAYLDIISLIINRW